MNILSLNNLNIKLLLLQFAMKQFSIVRSVCILLLSYFLLPCALFAQTTFSSLSSGDTLALYSGGKYIAINNNRSLAVVNSATSTNVLWTVTPGMNLKNLTIDGYFLRYSNSNSIYQFSNQYLQEIANEGGYWYLYTKGNEYYRPSVSSNSISSVKVAKKNVSSLDNTTKAYKVNTISEGGEVIVGNKVYGTITKNVERKNLSFSVPYTGGSCDLSQIISVTVNRPYTITTTTTERRQYYATTDKTTIKILKSTVPGETKSESGTETEVLTPSSFNIYTTATSISGQTIKGSSVIFPLNTKNQQITAKFTVEVVIDGVTYTETVTVTQARNNSGQTYRTFSHKIGQANAALGSNGLQQVHTSEQVVYALNNEEKHLKLQVSSDAGNYIQGFHRWFNYDNDATVNSGLRHTVTYNYTANAKGVYVYGSNSRSGETYYKMQGTDAIKIACDVAQYGDYDVTNTSIVEPTLSYRMVYDIRPASEMAALLDKCTSTPLETYNILAPAGKSVRFGPQYRWAGGANYVNYYYTSGGNVVRLDGYQWYKNGAKHDAGTITDNRLIAVTSPAAGRTDVYELRTTTGLIIARFNITSQAASSIGPSTTTLKSNADLDKSYDLKAYRNFDFADETGKMYSKPLPWDESTYGFTYSTGVAGSNKLRAPGFPDWSEYALIKNTNDYSGGRNWVVGNVRDHSNNGNGYFLFIDANEVSGKIADLKIDGDLCPNTSIWVSAWFVGIGDSNQPNLNFIVTGIDASGNEAQILTYTTGTTNVRGQWQQVLFEVKLDEREFVQYRLRIDNNGATATGNDFGIDDIRIYTSKPAVMGIQAMNACSADESTNTAILRVDFNRPGVMPNANNQKVYYRWMDNNTSNALALDYVGNNAAYGEVSVNTSWTTQNQITRAGKNYYSSLKNFLDSVKVPTEGFVEFYTIETVTYEDGTTKTHPVLYVVHNSEKFKVNQKYEAQIMPYEPDFAKAQCATKYVFDVRPRARILVDGVEQNTTLLQNLDLGTYTLSVRSFGNNSTTGGFESIDCLADWLTITNDMNDDQKNTYINELLAFRTAFPTGTAANINSSNYPNLKSLNDAGQLTLGVSSMAATLSKRGVPVTYVAVPLASSSNNKFTICPNPLEVTLRSEVCVVLAKPGMPAYDDMPKAVQGSPCVIRISESDVDAQLPDMEVKFINNDVLSLLSNAQQQNLFTIVLCETNDDDYAVQATEHSLQVYTLKCRTAGVTQINQLAVGHKLYAERTNANFQMKPGKYYHFHSVVEKVGGNDIAPAFCFNIQVVPNTVVWRSNSNNTSWHNDENWKTTNGATAFIPLAETNVIISNSATVMPVLSQDIRSAGSNQYLDYEIGVEPNSCGNIYFEANTQLANQQYLTYTKAYVDLAFDKNNASSWEMLSMPLEGVVRGDFFIPSTGDGTFDFSEEIALVDNRFKNAIRMKAYNSAISNTIIDSLGAQQLIPHAYSSAEWSAQTNVLNMLLEPARGYAFSRQCATAQNFVRLPKSETIYYTYYKYKDGREVPINGDSYAYKNIDRSNAHKLLFDYRNASGMNVTLTNVQSGQFFLVGNPFMANLDVKKFLAANTQFYSIFCYQYINGAIQGTNLTSPGNQVLRPMHAMFVQTKSNVTQTTVRFTPDMIATSGSSVPTRAKALAPIHHDPILTLTANLGGAVANTIIVENNSANAEFNEEEDAQLFMLDAELTPIGLYSVASQKALLYNAVADIINIPIFIMVLDSARIGETFALTFSGIDNFDETLYLYDAYYDLMYPLFDELTLDLELPQAGEIRYYITRNQAPTGPATDTDNLSDAKLLVVSTTQGATIIANENILSIAIYDIAGRKLNEINNINAERYQFTMPLGVYMLQISTESNTLTEKIIIK